MSYVAVMDEQMGGRQAEFSADRIDYEPELIGLVRFHHPSREKVGIQLGVGTWEQPLWFRDFRTFRWPAADVPFPDHVIAFDLTDGAASLRGEPGDTVFVAVIDDSLDGLSGSINYFEVEHLLRRTSGVSPDPPVEIPDHGVFVWANLHLPTTGVEERPGSGHREADPCSPTVLAGSELTRLGGRVFDSQGRDVTNLGNASAGVYYLHAGRGRYPRRVVVTR
jgi:hypothetical protein